MSQLYFMALLPDEAISEEVTAFKRYMQTHFGAAHALRSPPHVTLFPPFQWALSQQTALENSLLAFAAQQQACTLHLKGFNCFAPSVIYVDVVPNKPLAALQRALLRHLARTIRLEDKRAQRFHPHMTIAHRDLSKTMFEPAWAYFSTVVYERTCPIEALTLLHLQQGKWVACRAFKFLG